MMKNETLQQFQKTKKAVLKKYPNATTQVDSKGKYYVADEHGRDITNLNIYNSVYNYKSQSKDQLGEDFFTTINKEPQTPHADTVKQAWDNALVTIKAHHIINVNSERFSDEKVTSKVLDDKY